MKRRSFLAGAATGAIMISTRFGWADAPETTSTPKRKVIPPTYVPEVPKIVRECARRIPQICRQIQRDMGTINSIYQQMINEVERRKGRSGLSRSDQANLKNFGAFLKREHKYMAETATGRSPSHVPEGRRNVSPTFCDKANKALEKALGNVSDYKKRGRTNRDRVKDMKGAERNIRSASRIVTQARDTYIRRVGNHERRLEKTQSVVITKGIYTAARQRAINAALNRLRNSSSLIFEANVKAARLTEIAHEIYGR